MELLPICSEADYDATLAQITHYFEEPPEPGTLLAVQFDALAAAIEAYERQHWPIDPPETA